MTHVTLTNQVALTRADVIAKLTKDHLDEHSICMRFHGLSADIWIDAQEVAEVFEGNLSEWMSDKLGAQVADNVLNRDYEVVDDEGGLAGVFCSYAYFGSIDWKGYTEALEADLDGDELEVMKHLICSEGYTVSNALERIESSVMCTDLEDYAYEQLEAQGIAQGSFAYNYFDSKAYVNDMQCNGEVTTIRESFVDGDLYLIG